MGQFKRVAAGLANSSITPVCMLQVALTWLWVPAVLGFFIASYVGMPLTEALSFMVDDGWCERGTESIGLHCFGDFGLPYSGGIKGSRGEIFVEGNPNAPNTPFAVLLFDFVSLLPYRLGLSIYLAVALGAIAVAIIRSGRGIPVVGLSFLTVFGGILTLGTLVGLDRANHVIFMAPLAVIALTARDRFNVIAATVAFISLKVWGIFIVAGLIGQRKYREAAISCVAAIALNLLLLPYYSTSLREGLSAFIASVTDRDYGTIVSQYSVSFVGMVRRTSCVIGPKDWCPGQTATSQLSLTALALVVLLALALLAFAAVRRFEASATARYTPTIMLGFLAVPEAAAYNLTLTAAITAFIAMDASARVRPGGQERILSLAVALAVAITSVPIPLWFTLDGMMIRLSYVLTPTVWVAVSLLYAFLLWAKTPGPLTSSGAKGI